MKSIIIHLIILIGLFLWSAEVKVTLNPFSIQLPEWFKAISIVMLIISISMLGAAYYKKGLIKGSKLTTQEIAKNYNITPKE